MNNKKEIVLISIIFILLVSVVLLLVSHISLIKSKEVFLMEKVKQLSQNGKSPTFDSKNYEKEKTSYIYKNTDISTEEDNKSNGSIIVVVDPGDTLWGLAEQYLGDGNRWEEIYAFNRDNLKSTHLFPNQTLEIVDCSKIMSHTSSEVKLLSPLGCETWKSGTSHEISWIHNDIPDVTKAHLFCYEEDNFGEVRYRGAIDYNLPSLSSDPKKPNTYNWNITTSNVHSCLQTEKKLMINVILANDQGERLGSATSGPLIILP